MVKRNSFWIPKISIIIILKFVIISKTISLSNKIMVSGSLLYLREQKLNTDRCSHLF